MSDSSRRPTPSTLLGILPLVASLSVPPVLGAQDARPPSDPGAGADTSAIVAVVDAFHRALEEGDSARAVSLLADDARILEGGGVETREEYRSHHLGADMAFAGAVERERTGREIFVAGDVAWVASTTRTRGELRNREIDSRGAELAVLTRTSGGAWRIVAVHWSSRSAR